MRSTFSTEVTSSKIVSDNPLYQRTSKAYHLVADKVKGSTLEIGCGEGYGINTYVKNTTDLTVVDKSKRNLNQISKAFPKCTILHQKIPPMANLKTDGFDTIISFQVIEHIKDYDLYLREIYRLLKPGGKAYITTPNKEKTAVRNPWHYREFSESEIFMLCKSVFKTIQILGIEGNKKTEQYYLKSQKSVDNILAVDIFKLHNRLPRFVLRLPYEVFNRINRLKLYKHNNSLIEDISLEDYSLKSCNSNTLDFFCILTK